MSTILGMTDDEIRSCGYATHLPILKFVFEYMKPKNVMEWGMGAYSTPFFLDHCDSVYSFETSEEWYNKIVEKYKERSNFRYSIDGKASAVLETLNEIISEGKKYDLVFNDGGDDSRHIIAQTAQYWAQVIISHDTQEKQYRYENILLRDGWVWVDIMDYSVWTSVMTSDQDLAAKITAYFRNVKTYQYRELFSKDFTHNYGRAL